MLTPLAFNALTYALYFALGTLIVTFKFVPLNASLPIFLAVNLVVFIVIVLSFLQL